MITSVPRQTTQTLQSHGLTSPLSTLAFDWVYTVLVFLLTVGIYMDGWSHASFGPDQSILSEYHLLFYASLMAIGLWLFGAAFQNRLAGFEGLNALSAGYRASALGLIVFGVTGILDLGGHALFGFEAGNEILYSPTHIGLYIGWALLSIGPARSALKRQALTPASKTWRQSFLSFLPALIAWASFFNVMAFVSMNFFGTSLGFMLSENRPSSAYFGETLGIMGIVIQTAVTVGALAWLTLKFRLPMGTFTMFFLLHGLYSSVLDLDTSLIPALIVVGIVCDLLYAVVKPTAKQAFRFHSFNVLVALTFWTVFYGFVLLTNHGGGIWYTPYIWLGSVAQAGTVALLISFLATAALPSPDATS